MSQRSGTKGERLKKRLEKRLEKRGKRVLDCVQATVSCVLQRGGMSKARLYKREEVSCVGAALESWLVRAVALSWQE